MKRIINLLLLIIAVVIVYLVVLRKPEGKAGKKAPQFEAELIDGQAFSLDQLEGSYVLLDFWGSWCAPCRKENPQLVKLYQQFKQEKFKDSQGFEVVSVALEKSGESWRKVAEKEGFDWPYQIVQYSKYVLLSPIAQKYSVSNIPAKFLIGPKGEILKVNASFQELHDFLASKRDDL